MSKHYLFLYLLLFAVTNSQCQPPCNVPQSDSLIYTFCEVMPRFAHRNGEAELLKQLRNAIGAMHCTDKNLSSKILVKFVVDECGNVTLPEALGANDQQYDMLKQTLLDMKFTPGQQLGKPVRVYYQLPIYICYK